MSKSELLSDLKIDRSESRQRKRRPLWLFLAVALVAAGGYGAWFLWSMNSPLEVQTVVATAPSAVIHESSVLDANGYVVARRIATVSSEATGKVHEVFIEEGMFVDEGQLLATLDDTIPRAQLDVAAARLEEAEASLVRLDLNIDQAKREHERYIKLADQKLVSDDVLDQARLRLKDLEAQRTLQQETIEVMQQSKVLQNRYVEDMEIRAPFAGVVIAKAAQPGEMISPISAGGGFTRTGICTIVDMDSLEVEVDVAESKINRVKSGQGVTVELVAYPDTQMPAQVIAVIPAADRSKQTVRVRIGFSDRDSRVLPDMAVNVAFLEEGRVAERVETPPGVNVPASSVQSVRGEDVVWVVTNNVANLRVVEVAERMSDKIRLTEGLRRGERVIANLDSVTATKLSDGVEVSVVN